MFDPRSPRSAALVAVLLACSSVACRSSSAHTSVGQRSDPRSEVLLAGDFRRVVKPVTGHAEIIRVGDAYDLRLTGVSVAPSGPVRVYLVGSERADTTRAVVEADLKYDMGELDRSRREQRVALPSAPDPKLRSVVLYDPMFAINLGYAALREPPGVDR